MTRFTTAIALSATAIIAFAPAAIAGFTENPPAYRGDENSVQACFDYVGPPDNDWSTSLFNAVGSTYPLDTTPAFASDNGLDMRILLPNYIDDLPLKMMRIQLFFAGAVEFDDIDIGITAFDPDPTTVNFVGGSGGFSDSHFLDYEITPNPDFEEIIIAGDPVTGVIPGNLVQIKIDTISTIPSPGATALLALAGFAAVRRRR